MEEIKQLLRYGFQTKNDLTIPLSAPGSAGMECCFVNLVEPGDTVIVCQNGAFGARMRENVERCGATPVMVMDDWGAAINPQKLEDALKSHPEAKAVALVQAETSTGVLSDVETLCALAHAHDCLTIVDAVTSLGGSELRVDDWKIDAVYSGTQKCLSCPPGLSPVSFSPRAVDVISRRKTKVQSWFLDLNLVMDYWTSDGPRTYHHTAPINALYGLHEALLILQEEGLENAWQRHQTGHEKLCQGLNDIGLELLVKPEDRLPQLNSVLVPSHITDEAALRRRLLDQFNLEIGAGLGELAGKVWRIGLMGHSCRNENIQTCIQALKTVLN
tara:strand:- start:338 stop:1327 length:990 start_codon:yes stop_codon:yes gene_type:complete